MVLEEDSFRSWWLFLKQWTQRAPEDLLQVAASLLPVL